jgi:hypothetical protein
VYVSCLVCYVLCFYVVECGRGMGSGGRGVPLVGIDFVYLCMCHSCGGPSY